MIKVTFRLAILFCVISCADTSNADTQSLRSNDTSAMESIDSSALINDTARLPLDSTVTTVNH
jgi:hypothetical protein